MKTSEPYTGPFDGTRDNSQPTETIERNTSTLSVIGIFHTIQGEGPFCGRPSVFVRLAGCNLQCPKCDTAYTANREALHHNEIVRRVSALPIQDGGLVVITGGEPLRQPVGLGFLVAALSDAGFTVQIETNGVLRPPDIHGVRWLTDFSHTNGAFIVLSPKTGKVHHETLALACCLKYVVDHENVNRDDGLPDFALGLQTPKPLVRPPEWWDRPIYVQPADWQDAANERCQPWGCHRQRNAIRLYPAIADSQVPRTTRIRIMYRSGKRYGHELGLSACFRQWRADSHCHFLHGYPLAFEFEFEAQDLDANNWVVDFGSLKSLKGILEDNFDHKLLIAQDDPELDYISYMAQLGIADVLVVPSIGCEAFAHMAFEVCEQWLKDAGYGDRVRLLSAKVQEHANNWASYHGEQS